MEEKITVMITSAGGITGTFLIKHLSKNKCYRIIGVDMQENIVLENCISAFYQVPPCLDKEFISSIKEIIKKESVDAIIPVSSYDIDEFSKYVSDALLKDKMLVMPYEMHRSLHDKKKCYEILKRLGIAVPKIVGEENYPYMMKARLSSGSRNIAIIEKTEDFLYWSKKIENYVCVELLKGEEYTVDCLFDRRGWCIGHNARKRVKTVGGGVVVAQNCKCVEVDNIISILEKKFKICGPVNFQFKYDEAGNIVIFDFNTRLASGGLPLTVASGFDIPVLLIKLILGQEVEHWEIDNRMEGLTMHRYYEEVFY